MRTQVEKDAAIVALTKQKDSLPQRSMFGDDNWSQHESAIRVIKEDTSQDDIYDEHSAEEPETEENGTLAFLLEVRHWLDGIGELSDFIDEQHLNSEE